MSIFLFILIVQNGCQGDGYTLATRDDGQDICYFYMDKDYVKTKRGDHYDLNYVNSKQICEDKVKYS